LTNNDHRQYGPPVVGIELEPELAAVIEALPGASGGPVAVAPLASGITNRNFRVDFPGSSVVVRLFGRDTELLGIDRRAERAAAQAAARSGVAPEVVAFLPEHGALVTRFVDAERLPPERLERRDVLAEVVRSVRAIHAMDPIPASFDPFRIVREYRRVAEERGVPAPSAYRDALRAADRIRDAFQAAPMPMVPCHNDLLNANFLWWDGRVLIVDYEYAGMGDPFFDLGNLAVNNRLSEAAQHALLELYFGEVTPARAARLALMRIVSDLREAMWGVAQQAISALEVDYAEYADRHLARCLESAADGRFEDWLSQAAGPA
jgi:prepilin-type processing-associated H-X9-DG protein